MCGTKPQCEKQTRDEDGVAARDAANKSTESLLTATSDTGGGEYYVVKVHCAWQRVEKWKEAAPIAQS